MAADEDGDESEASVSSVPPNQFVDIMVFFAAVNAFRQLKGEDAELFRQGKSLITRGVVAALPSLVQVPR